MLTAAHCIQKKGVNTAPSNVLAQTYRWDKTKSPAEEDGTVYSVSAVIPHPMYDPSGNYDKYDAAILVVSVLRQGNRPPVFVPVNNNDAVPSPGARLKVMGWGALFWEGPSASVSLFPLMIGIAGLAN